MNRYRIAHIDRLENEAWDQFVENHPAGSIYQHSRWISLIQNTYGYRFYGLACYDDGDRLEGILPLFRVSSRWTGKRLVSLPFSPLAGPLCREPGALPPMIAECKRIAHDQGIDHVQLRCSTEDTILNNMDFRKNVYYRIHVLDLAPEIGELYNGLHKNCIQRPIRKSLNNGLRLRFGESEEDLKVFYRLQVMTRKKHGVPPQPYRYFKEMWDQLHPMNLMRLSIADYRDRSVAGIILLRFGDTVIYQNGASDNAYLALKPNHFLLWKAIEQAKSDGYRWFNFGTSTPHDDGLIMFKRRWGTAEHSLPYYYFPHTAGNRKSLESSFKYRLATMFFRHLPDRLFTKIGEKAYPHLG